MREGTIGKVLSLILPDASIVVFGGKQKTGPNETFVHEIERYKGSTWDPLASLQSPRAEHSTALLLPSGKVLIAGGEGRTADYEIYVPWYLAGCKPRPTWVTHPPTNLTYNTGYTIQYAISAGSTVEKVVLMRPGSVTHHFDFDQRYVELDVAVPAGTTGTLWVTTPAGRPGQAGLPNDSNAAPAGWYMMFLLSGAGVPSVAHRVRLQ